MNNFSHMQKIIPNLWFDDNAEEAVRYYTSIFKRSRVLSTSYYSEAAATRLGKTPGSVLTITFELENQTFMAINGGPHFTFSPAISLLINCETQAELDKIWKRLSAKGTPEQCGWLRDRYGVSWQVVPQRISELMATPGPGADAMFTTMLDMQKLDLASLEAAYENATGITIPPLTPPTPATPATTPPKTKRRRASPKA
jgi:predicted 3-demethylubiquinone-9 3-methyltransferase (glyoxalase superfamily)